MSRHIVSRELLDEATKAVEWYECTGMKVARPPAIPHVVAQWLLLKCKAEAHPRPLTVADALRLPEVRDGLKHIAVRIRTVDLRFRVLVDGLIHVHTPYDGWRRWLPDVDDLDARCTLVAPETP